MIRVFGLTNKSLFDFVFSFLEKLSEIRKHELYNVARLLYIRGAVAATSTVSTCKLYFHGISNASKVLTI